MNVFTLPKELAGKWVAYIIRGGRPVILAIGETLEHVIEKIKAIGHDPRFVQVDYVPEECVELLL